MWRERRAETKTVFVSSLSRAPPRRDLALVHAARASGACCSCCVKDVQERGRRAHARGRVLALVADPFCDDVGAAVPESEGVVGLRNHAAGAGAAPRQGDAPRAAAAGSLSPPRRLHAPLAVVRPCAAASCRTHALSQYGYLAPPVRSCSTGSPQNVSRPERGARPRCVGRHQAVGSRFLLARSVAHESCPPRPRTRTRPGHGRHPAAIRFSRGRGCGSAIV